MMIRTNKLQDATTLADYGLSIIPIEAQGKRALIKWTPYQSKRPSESDLKQWFGGNFGDRNVGIVTGAVSGVVVLDVDNLEDFKEVLPVTPRVKTGKGEHYYFKHPGFQVRNLSLPYGDLRGDGGYVCAPPSKHPNGTRYEWLVGFEETPLADLPDWLIKLAEDAQANVAANDNVLTKLVAVWLVRQVCVLLPGPSTSLSVTP